MPKKQNLFDRKTLLMTMLFAGVSLLCGLAAAETQPLVNDELGTEIEPPEPEYPYPNAPEVGYKGRNAARTEKTKKAKSIERPIKQNDEGEYFYNARLEPETFSDNPKTEEPLRTNEFGEYFYETVEPRDQAMRLQNKAHLERPTEMRADGEFHYATEHSPMSASGSFRLGVLSPPKMRNQATGKNFSEIYKDQRLFEFTADYEWRLTSSVGRLGLKFGSGVIATQGIGTFRKLNANRRANDIPQERFQLLTFPNQLTAIYRFQYSDKQMFVPFIEGGGGYFTFAELRDDGGGTKFGGAPLGVAAGGIFILLDGFDERAMLRLDDYYGINHVWLAAEFRHFQGVGGNIDFTSDAITSGFMFDF